MAESIQSLIPLSLPRDMVRVVFPITQPELGDPGLPTLPALLADVDFRWNYASSPGTPVTVTYGFSAVGPTAYDPAYVTNPDSYRAFTADEITSVENVLAAYQAVSGITFELATAADAQMVCRITSSLTAVGYGNSPPYSGTASEAQPGDFYIDDSAAGQAYIAFHEIGHSLGLAHAYDSYKPVPEDYGVAGSRLLSVVDQTSVYKPLYLYDTGGGGVTIGTIFHPTTPMPLDILALQMIYGANTATNAGNTVYTYDVNPNFYETIWDGGGKDTIDCSNQVNSCLITLIEGSYSTIGLRDPFAGRSQGIIDFALSGGRLAEDYNDGSNSLAIAFNAVIENATGGSAADRLIGNGVANRLLGGGGADTLTGASGNDTLDGGVGNDRLIATRATIASAGAPARTGCWEAPGTTRWFGGQATNSTAARAPTC